jgi:hypothetical protein
MRRNEVMRLGLCTQFWATEVVLLWKLGENEVLKSAFYNISIDDHNFKI